MRISKFNFPILILVLALVSCKPIYKCGDAKPQKKLFLPKIIQTVIAERDSLCTTLSLRDNEVGSLKDNNARLNTDIAALKDSVGRLNGINADLNNKIGDLTHDNMSKTEQFNDALKKKSDELKKKSEELNQKSDELLAKEKLLIDRENTLDQLQKVIARQDSITKRLNSILHNALLGFKSDELSVEIKNGKVYVSLSDKLLFASGSASIEEKGLEAIKLLADVLNKNTDIDILVEGHTDNIPIKTIVYRDNWDLSVARATTIVRMLIDDYKITPTRLTASGKGEFFPKVSNATPEGRAKNRRTEIILSPKLDEIMQLLKSN